jgi:hypothetical protein
MPDEDSVKKILLALVAALWSCVASAQLSYTPSLQNYTINLNGGAPVAVVPAPSAFATYTSGTVALQTTNGTTWSFGAPGGGGTNTLLDGTVHTDTLLSVVARGDVIVGNATPKWARLAKGAAGTALTSDGTDVTFTKPTLYEYNLKAQDAQILATNFPTLVKNGTNFPLMALSYSNQPATSSDAFWEFELPKYDTGNLTLRILWYTAGTTNNVIWRAAIAAVTPDADAAVTTKAFATDQSVTTAASATANRLTSSSITISNLDTVAAGDKVWIKITRDRTDTTTSAAFLVSARLSYAGIY